MKTPIRTLATATLLMLSLTACTGGDDADPPGGPPLVVNEDGTSQVDGSALASNLDGLPQESVSEAEKASLAYMREEEKLAHDVYAVFDAAWGGQLRVFGNIASSEATHTAAVLQLLKRYALPDPAAGLPPGRFANATLQGLYADLVAKGSPSLTQALMVGAQIEELDIADIQAALANIDNQDIRLVYENLMKGSRNHLRSFVKTLGQQGVAYTPVYLSGAAYEAIVSSPIER